MRKDWILIILCVFSVLCEKRVNISELNGFKKDEIQSNLATDIIKNESHMSSPKIFNTDKIYPNISKLNDFVRSILKPATQSSLIEVDKRSIRKVNRKRIKPPTRKLNIFVPRATQCNAPTLTYSELEVAWVVERTDTCKPASLNFTCTKLSGTNIGENIMFDLPISTDTGHWNISENLAVGTQYNCTVVSTDKEVISKPTSIIIPPGSLEINVTSTNTTLSWTAPFKNQTLTYIIFIQRLNSNHFTPPECENTEKMNFTYTTNDTIFNLSNDFAYFLPDYNNSVKISTTFWNISTTSGEKYFTNPSAAPGQPRNVSVEKYLVGKYETQNTLKWTIPCDSNGNIKDYHVEIVDINQNLTVLNQTVLPPSIDTMDLSLNLTYLAKYSLFNAQVYALGENNQTGMSSSTIFNTTEMVPPAPDVLITEQSSTHFTITWSILDFSSSDIISYLVHIYQLGANYNRSSSCPQPTNSSYQYSVKESNFTFYEAWPFYNYNVTVTAVALNGDGPPGYTGLTTNASTPAAPNNLTYVNDTEISFTVAWNLPCDVNGIIFQYQVNVSERYTEELTTIVSNFHISSDTTTLKLSVTPSHIYNIKVWILLDDGIVGDVATLDFTTNVGFPGIPLLSRQFASNTSFGLEWKPPIEKTGPIEFYMLNITSVRPLYSIKQDCLTPFDQKYITISGNATSYVYNESLLYTLYEVTINASTSRGYGGTSSVNISTLQGVPETVSNVTNEINNPLTEDYEATVFISFMEPCYTFGSTINYTFDYFGIHYGNWLIDQGKGVISDDSSFTFNLKPEFSYNFNIITMNELYENTYYYENSFRAPAGVPTFNSSVSSISVKSVSPGASQIVLKKEYFSDENGELKYIALILNESNLTRNDSAEQWDSSHWPALQEGRQITEPFWNPFEENIAEIEFTIGGGSFCNDTYCNERLKDDTEYFLTIRLFNEDIFRDSLPIGFRTDKLSYLGTILGIVFGILILAILGLVGFFIWKKKLYRKISQHIFTKTASVKPIVPNNKNVSPTKFIQYFASTQDKPEILCEQFQQLAEKSKEIQSEKTTHFANLVENKRKNRYVNISPYDDTRVKLLIDEDDEIGSDYINASYVKGCTGRTEYIATQGPLPSTCRDFWKMVIQENITIIVMVAQFIEKNKEKCYKYFPNNHENLIVGDDMEIRCSTELHFGTYLVRNLQIRKDSMQVMVTHMQFLEWPDFNIPSGTEHMLQFIYQIRERVRNEGGIVAVHCSAGVGRTGTLIAADMLLQTVNAGKHVDIFNTVLELRKQRVMMVQTQAQYTYLHQLVADHIDRPPTPEQIEATDPVYENMDMLQNQSLEENSSKRKEQESEF